MKRICHHIGPILLTALVLGATGGCTKQARTNRLLKTGNRDFNAEKYDIAEIEYKNVLRLGGLNPAAIGQLGRIYAKEGRLLEAHSYLLKATELQPNSLPFQLALGQVDAAFRDSTNATRIALRILSAQPANEEALFLLVDSAGSVQALRQEMEGLPRAAAENPAYHVALGMLALGEQKFEEAGNELRLAVAANPKSSQAYFALAELQARQKNGKEAAQALKTAAELAPPRSAIRSRYADYLMQSGAVEEARKILREVSEKTPDYIPGWVGLMNLALAERKYDDATKFADRALERDERNYEALLGRAVPIWPVATRERQWLNLNKWIRSTEKARKSNTSLPWPILWHTTRSKPWRTWIRRWLCSQATPRPPCFWRNWTFGAATRPRRLPC